MNILFTAGLRFWSDTGAWRGLKCENNVIFPPPQGWGTLDYYIVAGPPNLKRTSDGTEGPTSKSQRTEDDEVGLSKYGPLEDFLGLSEWPP